MATIPPVSSPHQDGTGGRIPTDGSSPTISSGFPGSDYLYSAAGTVKSSFTGFIFHVLNGAKTVFRTVTYILFYPFLNHYEAEISLEKLKNILTCIQEESNFDVKLSVLETNVRVAVRNKGDTSSAQKIIEAFAEAEKDEFEKIAAYVMTVQGIDENTIPSNRGSYVLSRVQNGKTSVTDFYHALNYYRMERLHSENQLMILEYQVQRSELFRGETPHTQKLLLFFASVNKRAFKEVAKCLAEINEEVKASNGQSLEEAAKKWIEDPEQFDASKNA